MRQAIAIDYICDVITPCLKLSWFYLALTGKLRHEKEIIAKTPGHQNNRSLSSRFPLTGRKSLSQTRLWSKCCVCA